nr:citrate lyase subunit alpha [Enterocloster sp. OA11]
MYLRFPGYCQVTVEPGESIDVVITDYGIAINPLRQETGSGMYIRQGYACPGPELFSLYFPFDFITSV